MSEGSTSRRCWATRSALFLVFIAGALSIPPLLQGRGRSTLMVVGSKHDLSVGTRGGSRGGQGDACSFCHTPHMANLEAGQSAPLWSRELSVATYETYISPTYDANPGTPSVGVSKLCLSCHDGTVASGQALGSALLGTDLSNDHPVGIQPVDDGQLVVSLYQNPPVTRDSDVKLVQNRVECTTCHEAHDPAVDPVERKFLIRSNRRGALCLACHDPGRPQPNRLEGWELSVHATATNVVAGMASVGPYGSVDANACASCHVSHKAAEGAVPILRGTEEETCARCHDGKEVSPPIPDVMRELTKVYAHPTTMLAGLHDSTENAFPLNGERHAECVDCHQPHGAQSGRPNSPPPAVEPALVGVSGFDGSSPVRPAANEYEVCFKCHADSRGKPQETFGYGAYGYSPLRQAERNVIDPKNLREKFSSTIARHNVSQPRRLSDAEVPSLRQFISNPDGRQGRSLAVGTHIYCADCHASDDARKAGGTGANGPHGSVYPHILVARYELGGPFTGLSGSGAPSTSYTSGPTGSAALCNMCHDVEKGVLADFSFTQHRRHVVETGAACATCHEPHGIQDAGGNVTNNRTLISFDLNVVGPDESGRFYFDSANRECYLTCHGVEHTPKRY